MQFLFYAFISYINLKLVPFGFFCGTPKFSSYQKLKYLACSVKLFNLKTKINGNRIKNKEQMWVQRELCNELFYTRTYREKIDSEKAAGGVLSTKKVIQNTSSPSLFGINFI